MIILTLFPPSFPLSLSLSLSLSFFSLFPLSSSLFYFLSHSRRYMLWIKNKDNKDYIIPSYQYIKPSPPSLPILTTPVPSSFPFPSNRRPNLSNYSTNEESKQGYFIFLLLSFNISKYIMKCYFNFLFNFFYK